MKSLIKPGPVVLRDLYGFPDPVASVYFRMEDPGGDDVALRRRMIRHQLLRAATGTVVLAAVENALGDVPPGPGAVAAFVGRDGSERTFDMPDAEVADRVSRSAVPDVVPFLTWRQYRPAYVLAELSPAGAEVSVRRSSWSQVATTTVSGPEEPAGYATTRASDTVAEALSQSGARLLVLDGDERAVQFFRGKLPDQVRHRVRVEALEQRGNLDQTLRAMVDAQLREAVTNVVEQSTPGGLGVHGFPAVIDALAKGQVRELLIGPSAETSVWFGPAPTDIAEDRSGLALPDAEKRQGPVADVLIRAATLANAEVKVVPFEISAELRDGVGAIRRFAD